MRDALEIVEMIKDNEDEMINRISYESLDVYMFLKKEFEKSDVRKNYTFQFVYRSFYRLDNAGLTEEFKKLNISRLCRENVQRR